MNTTLLKQLIKESVREAVREELIELFKSPNTSTVIDNPHKSQSFKEILSEEVSPQLPVQQKREFRKYTKNEMLNKILNETTVKIPQEGSMVSGLSDINSTVDGTFVPKSVEMLETVSSVNPEAADVLKKAFTKNYSQLLKAVEKKTKTPGYVPSPNVVQLEK